MTRQSYKDYMEALEQENAQLKCQIKKLEAELENTRVWDKRSLDEIISEEKATKQNVVSIHRQSNDTKSIGCRAFMEQYREYRKLVSSEPKPREIELDTSAIEKLKILIKEKSAN